MSTSTNTIKNAALEAADKIAHKMSLVGQKESEEKTRKVIAETQEKVSTTLGKFVSLMERESTPSDVYEVNEEGPVQDENGDPVLKKQLKGGVEVLNAPIASIANLEIAGPDASLAKRILNIPKKIAQFGDNAGIAVGSKVHLGSRKVLAIPRAILAFVGPTMDNIGGIIQNSISLALGFTARAVVSLFTQIAQLFVGLGAVIVAAVVAAVAIAPTPVAVTVALNAKTNEKIEEQQKTIEDQANLIEIQNTLLKNLGSRMAKLEADVTSIDEYLTEAEEVKAEEVEADEVETPAPGMSKGKKVVYSTAGLAVVGALALAAFNRQAVVDAAFTYAPALVMRAAPYAARLASAVGL